MKGLVRGEGESRIRVCKIVWREFSIIFLGVLVVLVVSSFFGSVGSCCVSCVGWVLVISILFV